jgi:hypothetical protein
MEAEPHGLQRRLSRRDLMEVVGAASLGSLLLACTGDSSGDGESLRPPGWGEETHSVDAGRNYETVFPDRRVHEMSLEITRETWHLMLENMSELFGPRGEPPRHTEEKPLWAPAKVRFNGTEWNQVGLRFTGLSTLKGSWARGIDKMPFKLDFDQFEDEFPETKDQRFYGFKQLTLRNNYRDPSSLRVALASDLMKEASLISAETAFCRVSLDYGAGPQDLGIYTMREDITDVVRRTFADNTGLLYKAVYRPSDSGASLAASTERAIESSFSIESDATNPSWTAIRILQAAIHSERRVQDRQGWMRELEALFSVDDFLKWLAASTFLEHTDAYGYFPHNYFLYHEPQTGRLQWISWDYDQIWGNHRPLVDHHGIDWSDQVHPNATFDKSLFGKVHLREDWPLISYLLEEALYIERYNGYVRELVEGPFEPSRVTEKIDRAAELLAPLLNPDLTRTTSTWTRPGWPEFWTEVEELRARSAKQAVAAREYLAGMV